MSLRIVATLSSLVVFSSVIVGCAAAPEEDVTGTSSRLTGKEGEASTENPSGDKPGAGEEAEPDAECVATCNTSVRAKCNEDETFCTDVCRGTPAAQVICMANAPSCAKEEWIRCAPPEPEGTEEGAPSGKPSADSNGGKPSADSNGGKPSADSNGGKPTSGDNGGK